MINTHHTDPCWDYMSGDKGKPPSGKRILIIVFTIIFIVHLVGYLL